MRPNRSAAARVASRPKITPSSTTALVASNGSKGRQTGEDVGTILAAWQGDKYPGRAKPGGVGRWRDRESKRVGDIPGCQDRWPGKGVIVADLRRVARGFLGICLVASRASAGSAGAEDWPPELTGAKGGTATLRSEAFLKVPASVTEGRAKAGAAAFDVAKTPPTVELAFHREL